MVTILATEESTRVYFPSTGHLLPSYGNKLHQSNLRDALIRIQEYVRLLDGLPCTQASRQNHKVYIIRNIQVKVCSTSEYVSIFNSRIRVLQNTEREREREKEKNTSRYCIINILYDTYLHYTRDRVRCEKKKKCREE